MHYTSIENIHKVIDPLFLDAYKEEFHAAMQEKTINTLRVVSAEMVQKANSGLPGARMGMAPMAYALWLKTM